MSVEESSKVGHRVYPSVEEMLKPGTVAKLTGTPVNTVKREPFRSVDGLSGAQLFWVETDSGHRFVLKLVSRAGDWLMRATEDTRNRHVLSWQSGLVDDLPPELMHGMVGCAADGDGWAILTQDFSEAMVPPGDDLIAAEDNETFLEAMAAMSAAFWGQAERADPKLGFCSLEQRYGSLTPEVGRRESGGADAIPPMIVAGWELFPSLVDRKVADLVASLHQDPARLASALRQYPQTVVHGDWKFGNLGIVRGERSRVALLDWSWVGPAPAGVELAWYLAVNCARLPVSKETTIASYEARLSRRLGYALDEEWWRPQLELAFLGAFVQLGWPKALGAARGETESVRARERAELDWWSAHALKAADYL